MKFEIGASIVIIGSGFLLMLVIVFSIQQIQKQQEIAENRYQYFATEVARCEATELFNREECVYLAGVK